MTPITDMVEQMVSEGVPMRMIVLAIRTAELAAARPVDEAAERRRAYDRARKAKKHAGGIPVEFSAEDSGGISEMHIGTSTSREEVSKKVRKKTISALFDVPDDASEENRTFAESKGWQRQRIDSEWQRFRDHSINKGKKHRNVAAAWRNWVTSPYQGAQNGQDDPKSALAAGRRQLAKLGGMEAARAYVEGSSGPTPRGLDFGDESASPKLISSR